MTACVQGLYTPKRLNTHELAMQRENPTKKTKIPGSFHDFTDNALRFRIRTKLSAGDYAHDYMQPPASYGAEATS